MARGMVVDYGVLAEGEKTKTTKNGKGRSGIVFQPGRPLAHVVVDVDVQYFQYKNKVERGVELKFSPLGASRGRGGRRRI